MQQWTENNSAFIIGVILFFLFYLFLHSIYLLIATIKGNKDIRKQTNKLYLQNRLSHEYYVPISIIIPTYNNEKEVIKTVKSLLNLDYNLYEIIVVDDASNDHTIKSLVKKFDLHLVDRPIRRMIETKEVLEIYQTSKQKIKITVLKKEHGGLADALNAGINIADFPYFVCLKEETRLDKDSLKNLVCPILEDDQVISCRGVAKALDEKEHILALAHTLSYNRAYHTRDDYPESNLFQLFKREMAIEVGGYDLVGENFELERKMATQYKNGIRKEAKNVICYLKSPNTLVKIFTRKKRESQSFTRGLLKYSSSKLYFLYSLLYKVLSPLIVLVGGLAIICAAIYNTTNMFPIYLFLTAYLLFDATLTIVLYIEMLRLENRPISAVELVRIICSALIEETVLKGIGEISKMFLFSKTK